MGNNPMYWPIATERAEPPTARLCGVLPPTPLQMANPIIAARWAARTTLMKEVWAKRAAFTQKAKRAKGQFHSVDRGASGGKKSKGGPSPPTFASAVKGWAAQGAGRDSQQPSNSSSGQRSRVPNQGALLR